MPLSSEPLQDLGRPGDAEAGARRRGRRGQPVAVLQRTQYLALGAFVRGKDRGYLVAPQTLYLILAMLDSQIREHYRGYRPHDRYQGP